MHRQVMAANGLIPKWLGVLLTRLAKARIIGGSFSRLYFYKLQDVHRYATDPRRRQCNLARLIMSA
jgi:hypothetical protein